MAGITDADYNLLYGEVLLTPFVHRPYKWTCTGMQGHRRRYFIPYTLVKGGWRKPWLAGSWFKHRPIWMGKAIRFRLSFIHSYEDTTIWSRP